MTIKYELDAEVRETAGRGASRRLRQSDKIPAVVYGGGQPAMTLVLDHNKTKQALTNESFYSRILTLKIGKNAEKVILKDVQRHPAKPRITHLDFLRIRADQKLRMNVPIHFIGEDKAPGLKEGGVISHHMSDVEVSCLPADLPEYIELDASNLGLNQSLHLSHLKLPKNVELVAFSHGKEGHDQTIMSIHVPKVEEEAPAVTAEAAPGEGKEGEAPAGAKPEEKEKKEK